MKKIFLAGLVIIVLGVTGCEQPTDSESVYTVWTYEDYDPDNSIKFGGDPLPDGKYLRSGELTDSQFNNLPEEALIDEFKHTWSESQIYNWFIGRGFGDDKANQETAWLTTISHGFIASRSGPIVYMILK